MVHLKYSSIIAAELGTYLGITLDSAPSAAAHVGCIAQSFRWMSDHGPLFVKIVPAAEAWTLEAEADGLAALTAAKTVRVPHVLACGQCDTEAYLALEWLDFHAGGSAGAADAELGVALAKLHQNSSVNFGWHCDNAIGTSRQYNAVMSSWPEFFREFRLRPQLAMAAARGEVNGRGDDMGQRIQDAGAELLERMHLFFRTHAPVPSLVHGDLWSGNRSSLARGGAVIFDPAVYYGDREVDLALTTLFGGFSASFYRAYEAEWPLDAGAAARVSLYNLYHVLNHWNLFGGAYGTQAEDMINRLLAEL